MLCRKDVRRRKPLRRNTSLVSERLEYRRLLTLAVSLSVESISESPGGEQIQAVISRDGTTNDSLEVDLTSSAPLSIWSPAGVTIPAGETSVIVDIQTVNNPTIDGRQNVSLIASSDGHVDGIGILSVLDDDTEDFRSIGGHLSGAIEANSYFVTSDLMVDAESSLVVEAGARLRFSPGVGIHVDGTLLVKGLVDSPVQMTSAAITPAPGDWSGIVTSTNVDVLIEHAELSFATTGISTNSSNANDIVIRHSEIHDNSSHGILVAGVSFASTPISVASNRIFRNAESGVRVSATSFGGPRNGKGASAEIVDNEIFGNTVSGIAASSSYFRGAGFANGAGADVDIRRNEIYDNTYGIDASSHASGTFGGAGTHGDIANNLIRNNDEGIRVSETGDRSSATLDTVNNTIVFNSSAGIAWAATEMDTRNNIIAFNGIGVASRESANVGLESGRVSHNLIFGNEHGPFDNFPIGFGDTTAHNRNGLPSDVAMNIFVPPMFLGDTYNLSEGSPAIDAGTDVEAPNKDHEGQPRGQA